MTEQTEQSSATFGKYQILEELGRGGFGIVYRAFDTVLEVERAIKELYPNLVNDPAFVNRFRQEARIAAKLDHPNLVSVYDFGQIDGKYYLSMGYMPGGSLKDLLKREGKLEPERAYEILSQVCDGLTFAHDRGIIHRDLKPGNILFDETGKARVADMGFAKVMSEGASRSLSASGSLIGTPAYMAPEIWKGQPAIPATDLYSLACILVEMLSGKTLFEGDTTPEVMLKHFQPLKLPREIPQNLRAVLSGALAQESSNRTPNLSAFMSQLIQAVKTATPREEPPLPREDHAQSSNESQHQASPAKSSGFSPDQTLLDVVRQESSRLPQGKFTDAGTHERPHRTEPVKQTETFEQEPQPWTQTEVPKVHKKKNKELLISIGVLMCLLTIGSVINQADQKAEFRSVQTFQAQNAVTQTAQPQFAATQTAQAQFAATQTAEAVAASAWDEYSRAVSQATEAFGPHSGELVHNEDDNVETYYLGETDYKNFALEATFTSPDYADESADWDFGIFIRNTGNKKLSLIITGYGYWTLLYHHDETDDTINSGQLDLNRGSKANRILTFLALEDRGLFFLDGDYITALDLSACVEPGFVALGTGFYFGNERNGAVTGFRNANLYVLDSASVATPAAISGMDAFTMEAVYTDAQGVLVREARFPVRSATKILDPANLDQIEQLGQIGKGQINDISLSSDLEMLAVASAYGIYILDPDDLSEISHFSLDKHIDGLAFFPGNHKIAAPMDGNLGIWDADSGELLDYFELDFYAYGRVSVSEDGKRLALTGYDDGEVIYEVNPNTGAKVQTLENHFGWEGAQYSQYHIETEFGTIKKVLTANDADEVIATGYFDGAESIKLNPDRQSVSGMYTDGPIRVWSFSSGTILTEVYVSQYEFSETDSNQRCLLGGWMDAEVAVWDLDQHQVVESVTLPREATSIDLSPNGHTFAIGTNQGETFLYDLEDANFELFLGDKQHKVTEADETVYVDDVVFSPDGKLVASGSWGQSVAVWEVDTAKLLYEFDFALHSNFLTFSPDGQLLAAAGEHLAVWNMDTGKSVFDDYNLACPTLVNFSPSGDILAVGTCYGEIYLMDPESGSTLQALSSSTGSSFTGIDFSDDGKIIAASDYAGFLSLWGIP